MGDRTADRTFAWVLGCASGTLLISAVLYANRVGPGGETLLAPASAAFEATANAGEALARSARGLLERTRPAAVAAIVLWLAYCLRRRNELGGLLASLGFGWLAQSYLLDGAVPEGLVLYGSSVAAFLLSRSGPPELPRRLPLRVELPIALVLLGLFVATCLFALDVSPDLYYDEMAWALASRMQSGELPKALAQGYSLELFEERFLGFEPYAFAARHLAPGVLPLRLVSLTAATLALVVAVLSLRTRVGSRATVWMLGLGAFSALQITYGRVGIYIVLSALHGALAVAALLRLHDRWNLRWAAALGLLLGASLYLYQLSWFVPVFTGMTLLVWPHLARRKGALAVFGVVVLGAASVMAPAPFLFSTDLAEVAGRTLKAGPWAERGGARDSRSVLLAPEGLEEAALTEITEDLRARGLQVRLGPETTPNGVLRRRGLSIQGAPGAVAESISSLRWSGWAVEAIAGQGPWQGLAETLRRLFYTPGPESLGRHLATPILNPFLAPLLVIGLLQALALRRLAAVRLALVWTLGALLLPPVLGGVVPRRCVLAIPWACFLMALPILRVEELLAVRGRGGRVAALVCVGLLCVTIASTGVYRSFRLWGQTDPTASPRPSTLQLAKVVNGLPEDVDVLSPGLHRMTTSYLTRVARKRVTVVAPKHPLPSLIRSTSCAHDPPFVWVTTDTARERTRFRSLARDFQVSVEKNGAYLVHRIDGLRPGGCEAR